MKTKSALHWTTLLLATLFFSACDQSEPSLAETKLLPNIEDINQTICRGLDWESVEIAATRIPYLQDQYTVDITDMPRCGMHMQLELLSTKLGSVENNSGEYFTATSIGLKAAGFTLNKNYQTSAGTLGKYMEVLNEGEFFGIVYASAKASQSVSGFFFGIPESRINDVSAFIRLSEQKFYAASEPADVNALPRTPLATSTMCCSLLVTN